MTLSQMLIDVSVSSNASLSSIVIQDEGGGVEGGGVKVGGVEGGGGKGGGGAKGGGGVEGGGGGARIFILRASPTLRGGYSGNHPKFSYHSVNP